MINGEDSEAEKRDILMEFIQNMAPDDKAIIFFGKKAKVNIYMYLRNGMYFDAVFVELKKNSLLFRLALTILEVLYEKLFLWQCILTKTALNIKIRFLPS